jgi:hypothetical protein
MHANADIWEIRQTEGLRVMMGPKALATRTRTTMETKGLVTRTRTTMETKGLVTQTRVVKELKETTARTTALVTARREMTTPTTTRAVTRGAGPVTTMSMMRIFIRKGLRKSGG